VQGTRGKGHPKGGKGKTEGFVIKFFKEKEVFQRRGARAFEGRGLFVRRVRRKKGNLRGKGCC